MLMRSLRSSSQQHEAGQVQVADLPHLRCSTIGLARRRSVAPRPWRRRSRPPVAVEVEPPPEPGVEERGLGHPDVRPDQPGEDVGVDRVGVEEPAVAAEDLVGRLARQGHRGLLPDRLEQQQERGVPVTPVDRVVEGGHHVAAARPGSMRSAVDRMMSWWSAPTCSARSWANGVSGVGRTASGDEVLGVAGEVDGEAADGARGPACGQGGGGQSGDGGGVEAARQQRAQRDVGDQLPADDVDQQVPHRGHRGAEVVGVGDGLQLPVAALAAGLTALTVTIWPGRTSYIPE